MKLPVQIAFRHIRPSEALETYVRDRVAKLDLFSKKLMSCRVVLENSHQHHHTGRDHHCRIDLGLAGAEIVVGRDPPKNLVHKDMYAAIDAAFDAAQRRIEDFVRRERGDVKHHEPPLRGWVVRLVRDKGYGFVEGPDGYDVYFHQNSVRAPGFDSLHIGSQVRFAEETGEHGPQASTVDPVKPTLARAAEKRRRAKSAAGHAVSAM